MNLKELRVGKGLTQKELADIIGVDTSSVSKYESGSSVPSFDVVKKLSAALDVSTDKLYGIENDNSEDMEILEYLKNNPDFKILFDRIRKGDKSDIQTLIAIHTAMRRTNPEFSSGEGD